MLKTKTNPKFETKYMERKEVTVALKPLSLIMAESVVNVVVERTSPA